MVGRYVASVAKLRCSVRISYFLRRGARECLTRSRFTPHVLPGRMSQNHMSDTRANAKLTIVLFLSSKISSIALLNFGFAK
jgi:hypothetical protein